MPRVENIQKTEKIEAISVTECDSNMTHITHAGLRATRGQGTSRGTGNRATRGGKERKKRPSKDYSLYGIYRPSR